MTQATPPSAASTLYQAARRVRVLAARVDFATFCELCLVDEESDEPIKLAPHHLEWIDLIRENPRLVLWAHVEAGKSMLFSVGLVLHTLGRDSTTRAAVISSACTQAEAVGSSLRKYIEREGGPLHEVFPKLRPSPEGPWNATRMTVLRPTTSRHASINLFGTDGPISGLRCDLLVCDDCVDERNSSSAAQRSKLAQVFYSEFYGRLTARARFVAINTKYHLDDLLHVLARNGVAARNYGVLDEATGQPRWPERWPMHRIEAAKRGMPIAQFARQLLGVLVSDEMARFPSAWIDAAVGRGARCIALGRTPTGKPGLVSLRDASTRIIIGCDPAAGGHDLTAICVVLSRPGYIREVLSVESGRWLIPDTIDRIVETNYRFGGADAIVVEAVGGFAAIPQALKKLDGMANIVPYVTNSTDRSLKARLDELEMELRGPVWSFRSENGRVTDPEIAALVQELRDLCRDDDRIEDRTVAFLLAMWGANHAHVRVEWIPGFDLMSR